MKIEIAKAENLQEIITLNKFVDYKNPDEFFKKSIENKRVLVATKDNKVRGFLLYQLIWGNTVLLSLLKIHPDYQQQGIGKLLLETFERTIQGEGHSSCISSTTNENTGSQIFHTKMGFVEMGDLDMPFGKEKFYKKELL